MRKKMMIPMIAIALVALVFFAGYGVMSDTGVEENSALEKETVAVELAEPAQSTEPATSEPDEATSEKADAEYAKLMERREAHEERYGVAQESDEATLRGVEELRQLRKDLLSFYQTYGWDHYDDFLYHDREALLKFVDEVIASLGDCINMVENDLMPLGEGETKEGMIALYENRIDIFNAFIEKVKAAGESDIRALSGELDYIYEIYENTDE